MLVSPYGSWRSPITSDLIVAESVRLDQVALDGAAIWWSESQPQKQGRCFVHRATGGVIEAVTPDDGQNFNVRSRVHEYGGGAFCVAGGTLWFSNFADQRIWRQAPGTAPRPITPAGALRYADAVVDAGRGRLICVGEEHGGAGQAANMLLAVDAAGARPPQRLVSGQDFYAAPRLSPDGAWLAWLAWDHPHMPWIAASLWVGRIGADGAVRDARCVAGGAREAVVQPEWSPDGNLWFVSDRDGGWWNLYRLEGDAVRPVASMPVEFGRAQWVFGMSSYAFADAARVVCAYAENGMWRLALVETASGRLRPLSVPFTEIAQVRAGGGRAVFIGGGADTPASLVELDLAFGEHRVIRRSAELPAALASYLSAPEALRFPSAGGRTAHAFWYPPRNPDFAAPAGEKVPVLVKSHGGPTSAASSTLSLGTQFWTSRGIGVLDVNYGGSTGYGRDYRMLLKGAWGIVDVEDCMAAARHVVAQRNADAARLAISGGSAGGYTTLRALTWAPPGEAPLFRAGASYYGVSDLEALARDTHKFESRYLDWLVGPYPAAKALYEERAPIRHAGNLSVPVNFFQGAEDRVVPPDQTERMAEALRGRGVPVAYFLFEGEQHGFRGAGAIRRCLEAELMYYAMLLLRSGLRF
jgi:dipeptidyl aminopeptidase/acylaminoacyl peptidase